MIYLGKEGSAGNSSVALGLFDGVHLGHRSIIAAAVKQKQYIATVLTFSTHTEKPYHKKGMKTILSDELKFQMIEKMGIQQVYCPDFKAIQNIEPEEFFKNILLGLLRARVLVCGDDFHFGKGAKGDTQLLTHLGEKYGIHVKVMPSLLSDGVTISSTLIRECLEQGNIEKANALLGYPYCFRYEVVYGKQKGRTWGFPTINQIFKEGYVVPRYGVYASKVLVDNQEFLGVTNIGIKPTISDERIPLAETHIIGTDKNYYGFSATVSLLEFIREEKKFSSIDELKNMVRENIQYVHSKYSAVFEK